nr:immunoglobulin heavy chain junction region [Mus musculus]
CARVYYYGSSYGFDYW